MGWLIISIAMGLLGGAVVWYVIKWNDAAVSLDRYKLQHKFDCERASHHRVVIKDLRAELDAALRENADLRKEFDIWKDNHKLLLEDHDHLDNENDQLVKQVAKLESQNKDLRNMILQFRDTTLSVVTND